MIIKNIWHKRQIMSSTLIIVIENLERTNWLMSLVFTV